MFQLNNLSQFNGNNNETSEDLDRIDKENAEDLQAGSESGYVCNFEKFYVKLKKL